MLQFLQLGSLFDLRSVAASSCRLVVSQYLKISSQEGIVKSQVVFIVFSGHD